MTSTPNQPVPVDGPGPTGTPPRIMAVVVSFNGLESTLKTVGRLLGQVAHVHVVDNGSARPSLLLLERLQGREDVTFTFLRDNRGIGYALNVGVTLAREGGYSWLLTMDQDSLADEAFIPSYCAAIAADPSLACLAPSIHINGLDPLHRQGPLDYAITSGNLVRMDVFQRVGQYDEAFFIDCVDFDFSLRVRRAGYTIHRVANAVLHHSLGAPHRLPRPLARIHTYHSPLRRYYIYRNFLYLAERHATAFPRLFAKLAAAHLLYLGSIAVLGEQRLLSLALVCRGICDYFTRTTGKLGAGH